MFDIIFKTSSKLLSKQNFISKLEKVVFLACKYHALEKVVLNIFHILNYRLENYEKKT